MSEEGREDSNYSVGYGEVGVFKGEWVCAGWFC